MRTLGRAFDVALLSVLLAALPGSARAGYYWGHGTLSSTPTVCFVATTLVNAPDWASLILEYIEEFEQAANIRFDYIGTCPPPVSRGGGGLSYPGDIRVALFPGSGIDWYLPVPGDNCPIGFIDSSFATEPDLSKVNTGCLYNVKLGNDSDALGVPWRNHTLHEFGHALGLAHEHQRPDALDPSNFCLPMASGCPTPADPAHELTCLTPYDHESVMNYEILECQIHGNYSQAGLSDLDKASLHVLYPEDARTAEVVGTRVVRTTEVLTLTSAWIGRQLNVPVVANSFDWRIDGLASSETSSLQMALGEGTHVVTLSHQDFLGQQYSYTTTVRSLSPTEFDRRISGAIVGTAATLVPVPEPSCAWLAPMIVLLLRARRRLQRASHPPPVHRGRRRLSRIGPDLR